MKSKRMRIILFIFIVTSCSQLPKSRSQIKKFTSVPLEHQIKPFQSDGCSVWPEGTNTNRISWIKCCIKHDIAYWKGGTETQKLAADQELKSCVEKTDSKFIAKLMKIGAGIGGKPQYKTSFKWGYGWNYQRGYLPLTENEQIFLHKLAPKKGEDLRNYLNLKKIDPEINNLEPLIY